MQVQEIEEVDEIGAGQRKSRDVVCWQCGEKGHLQCNCPYKMADDQIEDMDDPNAYALQEQQRINAAITSTLAAQAPNAPTQPAVTPQRVYKTRTV